VISPVDPCSAWTAKANKRVQFGYGLNYLIDIKYAVIVDVEATPARTYDEVAATKTMIKRTEQRLGLKPERLAADTAYGTGKFLHWVIGAGITPHIPVWDRSTREEGILSRADFTFDPERNLYICPQGKFLRTTGTVHDGRTILYRASYGRYAVVRTWMDMRRWPTASRMIQLGNWPTNLLCRTTRHFLQRCGRVRSSE
jgi:hypothetical protein